MQGQNSLFYIKKVSELIGELKILVAGGANIIGSALVRHLVRNPADEIVNVEKLICSTSR